MRAETEARFNKALDRIVSADLLKGRGIGNEIGFYIFDYPPEEERGARERIAGLVADIGRKRPDLRVRHVNLFDLVIDHLIERRLLDKAIEMQRTKSDAALRAALAAPLQADRLAKVFERVAQPREQDVVLVSGAGAVYPLLRTHSLLNNLHAVMDATPLVLFFPGRFDGQSLSLFNRLHDENYYRAFRLVP